MEKMSANECSCINISPGPVTLDHDTHEMNNKVQRTFVLTFFFLRTDEGVINQKRRRKKFIIYEERGVEENTFMGENRTKEN